MRSTYFSWLILTLALDDPTRVVVLGYLLQCGKPRVLHARDEFSGCQQFEA